MIEIIYLVFLSIFILFVFVYVVMLNNKLPKYKSPALFRIGTGGTTGTYYSVGYVVSKATNQPNIFPLTLESAGSVENIEAVKNGNMESGFAQANFVISNYKGSSTYSTDLRIISNLYPEAVHIVARKSTISSIADLSGKKVNIGEIGSGTLITAQVILDAYSITVNSFKLTLSTAISQLKSSNLDALFFVGGYPVPALTDLFTGSSDYTLLQIDDTIINNILRSNNFMTVNIIPSSTYSTISNDVNTLFVPALWITNKSVDDDIVYEMVKSLYSENGKNIIKDSHNTSANLISLDKAHTNNGDVPFHNGALRFYKEKNM